MCRYLLISKMCHLIGTNGLVMIHINIQFKLKIIYI
jgi:hypothetical protein